jgi:hypothetical protein
MSHSAPSRLGPLSVEQKKRAPVKRARLEKSNEEERRPQEIKEEDIQRSENETTKNVIKVGLRAPPRCIAQRHHLSRSKKSLKSLAL